MRSDQSNVLKDREFLKNTGKLFGSSVIAQAFPFIVLPFLTRMFSPEDFGFWAYFLSLSSLFSILMTGNYEFAIVLPKEDKEALNVFTGSLLICVMTFFSASAFVYFFYDNLITSSGIIISENILYLVILMSLIMAVFRLLNFWNNRENKFHVTAAGNITRSFTVYLCQLLNGLYFLKTSTGLILSSISGYTAGTVIQSASLVKKIVRDRKEIRISSIRRSLLRYKDFPKYFMPSEFLNSLSVNVPVLFLTNLFDSAAAGLYAIPHRFINVPLTLLGSSISQAYLKKSSDMVNNDQCLGRMTSDIYRKLFMLGIVPLSIIAGYGDYIFGFLLGEKWAVSGQYASILSPWMLMVFVASPVSIIFATLEKQKISLVLNSVLLILRVTSFLIGGIILKSVFAAIFLYGSTGFLYWTFYSFFVVRTAGGNADKDKIVEFVLYRLLFIMLPIILSRTLLCTILN